MKLSFEEAREWAQAQTLKSGSDWRIRCKLGLPEGIPTNPSRSYADRWLSWGDFLGTGHIAPIKRSFRSYQEASAWAREQGITCDREWQELVRNGACPIDIPTHPIRVYKEWTSFPSFFGTDPRRAKTRTWRSFDDAKRWAREAGIFRKDDWYAALERGEVPADIPSNLRVVYREWKGFRDFVGRGNRGGASVTEDVIAHELSHFVHVDTDVRIVQIAPHRHKRVDMVLKSSKILIEYDGHHWHKTTVSKDEKETEQLEQQGWCVIRVREAPLPLIGPYDILVEAGWLLIVKAVALLRQLLAIGVLPPDCVERIDAYEAAGRLYAASTPLANVIQWRPFDEAANWASSLQLTSETEWRRLRRKRGLPRDIPANPDRVYAVNWQGWGHWLGTGNRYVVPGQWVPYEQAREWARQSVIKEARAWTRASKDGQLPPGVPGTPRKVYGSLWEGWGTFLGTGAVLGRRRPWRSFEDARSWAQTSGARSDHDWRKLIKTGGVPEDVPKSPENAYSEWAGWGDWLGTGNKVGGPPKAVRIWRALERAQQ
ncbi:DUF559 domain-containing protein [Pseudomonas sp. PDM07]|nr:DUF559 domain-containing protein [Pseudomonas sp. PDM07]